MAKQLNLNFSVLRYIPSFVRNENIIVGVVFHIADLNLSFFRETNSFTRVKTFDDELDRELYNADMKSFHEAFDSPNYKGEMISSSTFDFSDISNENFLSNKINHYANEYRFDDIAKIKTDSDNYKKEINNITDIYLYYDKPKKDRIDNRRLKRTLSKILINNVGKNNLNNALQKYKQPLDKNRNVFDFEIRNNYFKVLTFDYSRTNDLRKQIQNALLPVLNIIMFEDKNPLNIYLVISNDYERYQELYDELNIYIKLLNQKSNLIETKIIPIEELASFDYTK